MNYESGSGFNNPQPLMVALMADISPGVTFHPFIGIAGVPKVILASCTNGTIVGELKDA